MSRIYSIILSIGVFIIAIDQWTKNKALGALTREGDTIPFMPSWSWTLVYNRAAAFGMFHMVPDSIRVAFFILMPTAILAILWWSYVRKFDRAETLGPIAIGLVFGGAVGNLIDRVRFTWVIDFIDWYYPSPSGSCAPLFFQLRPGECHWPVFNVADSAISFAMVLLAIHYLRTGHKHEA